MSHERYFSESDQLARIVDITEFLQEQAETNPPVDQLVDAPIIPIETGKAEREKNRVTLYDQFEGIEPVPGALGRVRGLGALASAILQRTWVLHKRRNGNE